MVSLVLALVKTRAHKLIKINIMVYHENTDYLRDYYNK